MSARRRSGLRTVVSKELTDARRDRRSLASALAMPLLGPALAIGLLTQVIEKQTSEKPLQLAIEGEHNAPALVEFLQSKGVEKQEAPANPEAAVVRGDHRAILVIPEDFGERFRKAKPAPIQIVADASRDASRTDLRRTRALLQEYSHRVGALRLLGRGVSPQVFATLQVDTVDVATPKQHSVRILGMVPLFILLAAFMGGLYVATDSTAGERERGSLEPLLTTPTSRWTLVAGKWLATATLSAVSVVATTLVTTAAMGFLPAETIGMTIDLGPREVVLIAAAAIPVALASAGMQVLVASFARSFREAQTYLSALILLPMVPGMLAMLEPGRTALWMMAVPVYGQQMLLTDVLRGEEPTAWHFVLSATAAALVGLACARATAYLFRREKIVFGDT